MKVVILAGGFGTRLSEYTSSIPKPMVEIGGSPILWHIMNIYSRYGLNDFVIALGYKGELIKDYFMKYYSLNSDINVDLSNGTVNYIAPRSKDWKISLINTGLRTMTGGRIKLLKHIINDDTFMMTYGDAVSNINLAKLLEFHKKHKKIATVTAVHPQARFGELAINSENLVENFKEKPQTSLGWINGGFFVFEKEIFNFIDSASTILEKEPLETLANTNQLYAYKHSGFWQSMDTLRDKQILDGICESGEIPWMENQDIIKND